MKKLFLVTFCLLFIINFLSAQMPVQVGAGSYAEYVPESVYDEGAYFGKSYRELKDGWPWFIHPNKVDEPIPTNDWWTAAIFERYTGRLEAFPHRVEGTANGVRVSVPTGFVMHDDRGLSTSMDTWVYVKGNIVPEENNETIVFADFESETYPAGWHVTDNPPYPGPVSLADINQAPAPSGFLGTRFINTFNGDGPQVTLTSPSFVIEKDYIHMLVGGGNNPDATYVGLFINGNRVLSETGENSPTLTWRRMDVAAYKGQSAEIRIVDASSGGWGFIMCDNIVFSDSQDVGSSFSNAFWPQAAKVYDWSELSMVFRLEDDNGNRMDGTVTHGVPFTYIDMQGIEPVIETSHAPQAVFNAQGQSISQFPANTNTIVLQINGDLIGLHAPVGASFEQSGVNGFEVDFAGATNQYLTVSWIPDVSLIAMYDNVSRNKITNTRFEWDYQPQNGKITTTFQLNTQNYESGAVNQPVLMALLPHHHRNTNTPSLIAGADYTTMRGLMHTVSGNTIEISYDFGGMPPFMPEPLGLTETQEQRMFDMISTRVMHSNNSRNGNTYAKGFGEETNIMLMARQLDHPGYGTIRDNVRNELIDWLTYDPSQAAEGRYFFARYPEFGALIGFPSGYGSQALNDLHFHYGYFIMGAARLMLVDDEFKNEYADIVKEVAKSYVNWVRDEDKASGGQPFLRTFDPYMGHSWAGGIGSPWDGNNQESSSEATNSWFALYLLGVALEDDELTSLGATGFMLEGISTANYWFNRHGDLPQEYIYNYVGINRANNMAMATYFHGDPAWAIGIQFVPCNFYYHYYLGDDAQYAKTVFDEMLQDRITFGEATNTDYYDNISGMGAYLGGYHLNYVNSYDPGLAASLLDQLYEQEGGEWTTHVNAAVNYYNSNAGLTYGRPAPGYHTDLPTGAVYHNPDTDELTYLIYNHSTSSKEVGIYLEGTLIETVTVGPRQFYNSQNTNQRPVAIAGNNITIQSPENSVLLNGSQSYDSDGHIVEYEWTMVSGEAGVIENADEAETVVSGLTHGVYVFRLKVTDNEGATSSDQVSVTVLPNETEINIALNKPAWASSVQDPWQTSSVNDGNLGTRWGSEIGVDPQWVAIDLQYEYKILEVVLRWEGAFASKYEIHLSNDPDFNTYTVLTSVDNGQGGVDRLSVDNETYGRYIRMYGIERGTPHGYSLWEFEVYGLSQVTSINENKEINFSVAPNPTSGEVVVYASTQDYHVQVFNVQGSLLYHRQNVSGNSLLNLSSYGSGIYFVRFFYEGESKTERIIVR